MWTKKKANSWFNKLPWIVGCNFIPSTAINQLEMWQNDTFDIHTIGNELDCAVSLGFNTVRVYLHDLLWLDDDASFLKRIDEFLTCANSKNIKTIFVFFEACWNNGPFLGEQIAPIPNKPNSEWMQSPSSRVLSAPMEWGYLEKYVKGVLSHFANDSRILAWDLYNEPGNEGLIQFSYVLLERILEWARSISLSQPVTVGIWDFHEVFTNINRFTAENSDIVTFHCYEDADTLKTIIDDLSKYGRPMICTEYMAQPHKYTLETAIPIFKKSKVGAISWGLINRKTQTHIPWNFFPAAYKKLDEKRKAIWLHDIFHRDGTPYTRQEIQFIREIIKEN